MLRLFTVLLLMLIPVPSHGETIAPGLTYEEDQGYHVLVADVGSGLVEVRVNRPKAGVGADFQTTKDHALAAGALAAINANYFDLAKGGTCGAARGLGDRFTAIYKEQACGTSLGWSQSGAEVFTAYGHETEASFRPEFTELVTGGGALLKSGPVATWYQLSMPQYRAMTALGVSADRKKIVLVVTDKTLSTVTKMKSVFSAHGAVDAIFLDGGGSTHMWITGKDYVNLAEGADRKVPVAVMVMTGASPPADAGRPDTLAADAQVPKGDSVLPPAREGGPALDGGPAPDGGSPTEIEGGCACAAAGSEPSPSLVLMLAALVLVHGSRSRRALSARGRRRRGRPRRVER